MEENRRKVPVRRVKGNHLEIRQTEVVTNSPRVTDIVNAPPSDTDPQGSYTGNPLNENEVPVQDADDL